MLRMLTWGPTGPLGESGGSSVGKDEESDVERRYLQDSSIHLCWIRIDRSAFVSKYWTYWSHTGDISSVNWCILFVNRCLTFSTTSMAVYGRGTEWGLTNLSADVLWIRTGAFFSQEQWLYPTLLDQCERLSCTACREHVRVVCIIFLLYDVHRFKSLWLSDISNRLSYVNQHMINLFGIVEGIEFAC
jgi:hypothetical protein